MKLRKGLIQILVIVAVLATTFGICTTSKATIDDSKAKLLKLIEPTYRYSFDNGSWKQIYAYCAGFDSTPPNNLQSLWKIYEYNKNENTVKNFSNNFYCIKAGPGFGSVAGSPTDRNGRTYNEYSDMKNPEPIITGDPSTSTVDGYIKILPGSTYAEKVQNYNSLVWVLDHCYVLEPAGNASVKANDQELANLIEKYKEKLLTKAGVSNQTISFVEDDFIDLAQQVAIWYFTNDDKYRADGAQGITSVKVNTVATPSLEYSNWESVNSVFYGDAHNSADGDIDKIFSYFKTNGDSNKNTLPSNEIVAPITFENTTADAELNGDYYIVGPYKINEVNDEVAYTLTANMTKADGTTPIDFTLLDSNKQVTTNTIEQLVGSQFYIRVSRNVDIANAKFNVNYSMLKNKITFWTISGNLAAEQPLAEVVPEKKTGSVTATVNYEEKIFDLALRKFIVSVNGNELKNADNTYTREPNIDLSELRAGTKTTAEYKHEKEPVNVAIGDIVVYALRIYNEGDIDGYASEVTDHLPPQLEFINDEFNAGYGWSLDPADKTNRTVKTKILARTQIDPEENLIKAYDGGRELDYKEILIKCKVKSVENLDKIITNIADITGFTDANGNTITDRDSYVTPGVVLPSDANLPDYKGNEANKSVLNDKNYHYRGQQDDDDFEKLVLQEFDLALRKFITKINEEAITSRIPQVDVSKLKSGEAKTATYTHPKNPLEVETTDIVEYTIRVYNEGDIAGYANVVKDDIPEGLEFLPENEINKEYRWKMLDKDGNETDDVSEAVDIVTDYLSKEQETATGRNNLLRAFDISMSTPDYRDVKVAFKVIAPNTYTGIITNKAQISDDKDENGRDVEDRDSTPDEWIEGEDDQDVEHIKLLYFDLALRKFITAVNDKEITDRIPVFKVTEDGKFIYEHTKEPVEVENNNVVTYTLRIFNEGTTDGYANQVKDDIPKGLVFLPDNETNKEYRWVMLDEDGNKTDDVSKAKDIVTDYLSKEQEIATGRDNLIRPFDKETMESPDYRDVKVAFKVTEPNTSDRVIINYAQISDDKDKDGKDVTDIDSTPDKWIEGEDDQDIEKIKVKYFDLALRKWVTQAIVIENGKETVVDTGHKAEDDPEEVVKVDLKDSNYKKVVVKFRYSIRITNEGQIAGYCTEISDYIPEGLKFVQEDNPKWKEVEGKIVTDQLKDKLLQPGESAEVEVLLTWINGRDNFGLKINTAEISKDKNDSDTPDIDSTPNNLKEGEDDIDDAPVLLTVKTGTDNVMPVVGVVAISIAIIGVSAILIKRYVLL